MIINLTGGSFYGHMLCGLYDMGLWALFMYATLYLGNLAHYRRCILNKFNLIRNVEVQVV